MDMKIAGVMTLYNPEENVIDNLGLYLKDLDVLYVMDNSDEKNHKLTCKLKDMGKVLYMDNRGNKGVAYALNRGASLAIRQGYEWLLAMDQDSRVDTKMVETMLNYIIRNDASRIGIVAPQQYVMEGEKVKNHIKKATPKMSVMTSGSLINLTAFKNVGRFEEKLFIEHVDNEYCLRLLKNGYKIIELNDAILYQKFGNRTVENGVEKLNYAPVRSYYRIRNALYVYSKYKERFPHFVKENLNDTLYHYLLPGIIFEDEKMKKIFYILMGIIDYKLDKYGKYKSINHIRWHINVKTRKERNVSDEENREYHIGLNHRRCIRGSRRLQGHEKTRRIYGK